jgi:D-glycero-beta-D-manno-heptose 1-phosphate adenylyltransferase
MGQIIRELAELKRIIDGEKERGRKVVFGNGCFDLLHVGHVRYLKGAKALGDVLIVAVNDDSSVTGLGKRKQVVTPARERAEIIAAIEGVDYVILFSEPNVESLLRILQPHIHAKGTDYTEESVPEGEIVRAYGGRVAIVGDPKDHSTRDLIKTIKELE